MPQYFFWVMSVIAVIWHIPAVLSFVMTVTENEGYLSQYEPEYVAHLLEQPMWQTAIWAGTVFSGLIGGVLLLLRSALAAPMFLASMVLYVAHTVADASRGALAHYGAGGLSFSVVIFAVGVFFIWFANRYKREGVLR